VSEADAEEQIARAEKFLKLAEETLSAAGNGAGEPTCANPC